MKRIEEYLDNFGKKYYLFGFFNIDGKTIKIPLYHGSLRSILKYTTYKNIEEMSSIDNESDLRKVLKYNLLKNRNIYFNIPFDETTFFISSDKNCRNKMKLKYSNSRDLLFCNSEDIYYAINHMMIKKYEFEAPPIEKLEFAKFICELIDQDYKEKLKESREEHVKTTNLDVIRKLAGNAKINSNLSNITFEKLVLYDYNTFITAIEFICKDVNKKEKLINKVLLITNKKQILSNKEMDNRSYKLTCKLKKDCESRKYLEGQIYNVMSKMHFLSPIKPDDKKNINKSNEEYETEDSKLQKLESELNNSTNDKLKESILKKYQQRSYELYLMQENIPLNDAGEPLYDQDYDIEKDKTL